MQNSTEPENIHLEKHEACAQIVVESLSQRLIFHFVVQITVKLR